MLHPPPTTELNAFDFGPGPARARLASSQGGAGQHWNMEVQGWASGATRGVNECNGDISTAIGSAYGEVIKRIGTGDDPEAVGVDVVAVLLQPATFSTVTFGLPFVSTPLMNTCRNPTMVTGAWLTLGGN